MKLKEKNKKQNDLVDFMKKKTKCGYCEKEIEMGLKRCPHCGKKFLRRIWKKRLLVILSVSILLLSLAFLYPYLSVKYYFPHAQVDTFEILSFDSGRTHGYPWATIVLVKYEFVNPEIGLLGGLEKPLDPAENQGANVFKIERRYNIIKSDTTLSLVVTFIPIPMIHSGMSKTLKGYLNTSSSPLDTLIVMEKNTNLPSRCFDWSQFSKVRFIQNCDCGPFERYALGSDGQIWELSPGFGKEQCG